MKLSVFLFLTLLIPATGEAQAPHGAEAESKFLKAIENGEAQILAQLEFPNSRDSSCDYIIVFRELSISWICYASPSRKFCGEISKNGRFNELIPVSREDFLSDYERGSDSVFCFSPGPIQYR